MASGAPEESVSYLDTNYSNFDLTFYNLFECPETSSSSSLAFSSLEAVNPNIGLGNNWMSSNFAYFTDDTDASGDPLLAFVWRPGRGGQTVWFKETSPGVFAAQYGARYTLKIDGGDYRVTATGGSTWVFDSATRKQKSFATPGGQTTENVFDSQDQLIETRRSYTEDSVTTVESLKYEYDRDGNVERTTLRRGPSTSGPWTNISRVDLEYYGANESFGNAGDLKRITNQRWQAGAWRVESRRAYRYYTDDSGDGYQYALRSVLSPEDYRRMEEAGLDPLTAANELVEQFASAAYEYDAASRRVTEAITAAGTRSYTIAYTDAANTGVNEWATRAIMTAPDGSIKTVFANAYGQDLLVDHRKVSNRYIHHTTYTVHFRPAYEYSPSSIDQSGTPYNPAVADLDVQVKSDEGLVRVTTYYAADDLPNGEVAGYPEFEQVQRGSNASSNITLRKYQYTKTTINAGTATEASDVRVSQSTVYRDEAAADPVTTEFEYTYFAGTLQLETRTTELPDVPASENGVGFPQNDTRVEEMNLLGQLIESTDARGTVTAYSYDLATGAMTQMVQDSGGLNLVTDYTVDNLGRTIQTLGPEHDVLGQAARTASWTVHKDARRQVWSASGYVIGGEATLAGPVSVTRMNADGQTVDSIQSIRTACGAPQSAGALSASDCVEDRSQWVRWTHNTYNNAGQLTSSRVYHTIPDCGDGEPGVNYDETRFEYDEMGRQDVTVSPGGTITRTTFDIRNLPLDTLVGTSDPCDAADGNMRLVASNEYDDGETTGDGLLTQVTRPVNDNAADDRIVRYQYDWRNRQTATITDDGTYTFYAVNTYDNLDRVTQVETQRQDGPTTFVRIAQTETLYDTRGRVYQSLVYSVADAGALGNSLVDNSWFDAEGNTIKSAPAGSESFTKATYDALNRQTASYLAYYNGGGTDDPATVASNIVVEQSENQYDAASQVIFVTAKRRYHTDTSTTGALGDPTTAPNARVSYVASWQDGVGRQVATANYGTNGGTALTRPDSPPASSDDVLVSQMVYNDRGEMEESIDPAGKRNFSRYDDAGRQIETIANYGGQVTQTVRTTYTPDGQTATLTALNPNTGDQVTTYTYGTTLGDSGLASSSLLRSVTYPDGGVVTYAYNRQSEQTELADQNGSVHQYARDQLGRLTADAVTTLASSVDGSVRRISQAYDNRMRLESVTSYDAASGGNVVNQVQMDFNDFSQVATEYQEHDGAVNTSTSPRVGYSYADGSENATRRTGITYPDGAALGYGYSSTIDDKLSRVSGIDFKGTTVAEYTYLGAANVVQVGYADTIPEVQYNLAFGAGSDPYQGLDRFDRVIDLRWERLGSSSSSSSSSSGAASELVHLKYGYDRASNRLWREDLVAKSYGKNFDELYTYDGLDRLIDFNRGQLNAAHTTITGQTLGQRWALDETGNWSQFSENSCDDGTSCDALVQNRTHNEANEITAITPVVGPTWSQVAHDANGNMTTLPQPKEPTKGYLATWDAWNRLVSLHDETVGLVVSEYQYDGTNRRTVLTDYESGAFSESTDFYYSDAWQVLEEHRVTSASSSSSTSSSTAAAPYKQYVWGIRYVDDYALQDRDSSGDGTLDERSYGLQDAIWNVVAMADQQASIIERYAYDAYGNVNYLNVVSVILGTQASSIEQPYLFTGRRLDQTQFYHFRARYYDAALGRFSSRDSLGYVDGMSLYRGYFVPNGVDPLGYVTMITIPPLPGKNHQTEIVQTKHGEFYVAGSITYRTAQPTPISGGKTPTTNYRADVYFKPNHTNKNACCLEIKLAHAIDDVSNQHRLERRNLGPATTDAGWRVGALSGLVRVRGNESIFQADDLPPKGEDTVGSAVLEKSARNSQGFIDPGIQITNSELFPFLRLSRNIKHNTAFYVPVDKFIVGAYCSKSNVPALQDKWLGFVRFEMHLTKVNNSPSGYGLRIRFEHTAIAGLQHPVIAQRILGGFNNAPQEFTDAIEKLRGLGD